MALAACAACGACTAGAKPPCGERGRCLVANGVHAVGSAPSAVSARPSWPPVEVVRDCRVWGKATTDPAATAAVSPCRKVSHVPSLPRIRRVAPQSLWIQWPAMVFISADSAAESGTAPDGASAAPDSAAAAAVCASTDGVASTCAASAASFGAAAAPPLLPAAAKLLAPVRPLRWAIGGLAPADQAAGSSWYLGLCWRGRSAARAPAACPLREEEEEGEEVEEEEEVVCLPARISFHFV